MFVAIADLPDGGHDEFFGDNGAIGGTGSSKEAATLPWSWIWASKVSDLRLLAPSKRDETVGTQMFGNCRERPSP